MRQRPTIGNYIILFVVMFVILICATTSSQSRRLDLNQISTPTFIVSTKTPLATWTATTTPQSTTAEVSKLRKDVDDLKAQIDVLSKASTDSSEAISQLENKVDSIDLRLSGLEQIIVDNPEEALQVVLLEKDISALSKEANTLQQELDRFSSTYLTLLTIVIAIVTLPYFGRQIREVIDYIQGRNQQGNADEI